MANSVDPDQTAPSGAVWSESTLFAYVILSELLLYEILGHLLYKYIALNKKGIQIYDFLNSQWGASNEYLLHMFSWRNKKTFFFFFIFVFFYLCFFFFFFWLK